MYNPFSETLWVLMLTMVIALLFDKIIANAIYSAMITQSPGTYARAIRHVNRLDALRNSIVSEDIRWRHG